METLTKSKNPVRDYRKAVVAVLSKYYVIDATKVRFSINTMRSHRASGESPAYVAFSIGKDYRLPLAPEFQRKRGR